jgi:hypothetical protein
MHHHDGAAWGSGIESMVARLASVALVTAVGFGASFEAQTRRPPARRAPPAPALKKAPAEVVCPAPLGVGVKTKTPFCNVIAGRDPAAGVLIKIPPHRGIATISFDLHNLHHYSEEQVRAKKAFARYTATIGVLTMDNTLISRAVVMSEFRTAADFVDRVGGGAGPGGVKAVAPTGVEPIVISVNEADEQVSLLGEKLTVETLAGPPTTFSQTGRPIAVVSNVMVEYRPAPPKRPARGRRGG